MNKILWLVLGAIIVVIFIFSRGQKPNDIQQSESTSVWTEYRSNEHNFIVEFPSAPQIEKSTYDITPGVTVEKYDYGSEVESNDQTVTLIGVVVEKMPSEIKISDPKKILDLGIKKELENGGTVINSETGYFLGKPSDFYKLLNSKGVFVFVKRIYVGNTRYSLRIASSSSSDETFNRLSNSFRFIKD